MELIKRGSHFYEQIFVNHVLQYCSIYVYCLVILGIFVELSCYAKRFYKEKNIII